VGEKLLLDSEDPFFEPDKIAVKGVAGSCYCCSQQIHVLFQYLDELPLAKINKEHFYVFLCDQCEDDIEVLKAAGLPDVSYDVLWVIQEPLEDGIYALEESNGDITSVEREALLISLYKETELSMNKKQKNKYIDSLSEEDKDEEKVEPRPKEKNSKNS
jgi:hypothetical protein